MLDWRGCPWCFGLGRWQTGEECNVQPIADHDGCACGCDVCSFEQQPCGGPLCCLPSNKEVKGDKT